MTAYALDIAHRSATFLSSFIDALNKAIAMRKAIHLDHPSASDLERVRAIADTL